MNDGMAVRKKLRDCFFFVGVSKKVVDVSHSAEERFDFAQVEGPVGARDYGRGKGGGEGQAPPLES